MNISFVMSAVSCITAVCRQISFSTIFALCILKRRMGCTLVFRFLLIVLIYLLQNKHYSVRVWSMKKMLVVNSILMVVFLSDWPVLGHVSLRFPPARKYDLDFLDSVR